MPTTLWSRVYLKYLARPPTGACSISGSGLPAISRNRSLKTPSPASQPTVPNTYPRTIGQSLVSLRPCAKLALADCTCRPSQLPMNQPITAPIRPVCTAGFRHQALTSAGPPGSPPTGWTRSAPRSEEHTSELQSPCNLVCRLLLEKKKKNIIYALLYKKKKIKKHKK